MTGKSWRNAVDLRHLPEGTHSLAPRPGSLVRLAFRNGDDDQGGELLFESEERFSSEWNLAPPDSGAEGIPAAYY